MFVLPTSTANNMALIVTENKSIEQIGEMGSHFLLVVWRDW
jgi:hypothetical protein